MNILRDKFPCQNVMFAFGWLSTGETVQNLSPHHFQRFSISIWNNFSKTFWNQPRIVSSTLGTIWLNYYFCCLTHCCIEPETDLSCYNDITIHNKNHYDNYHNILMVPFPPTTQVISTPSSTTNFIFLQTMTFKCLLICIKVHPTPYKSFIT